MEFEEPLQAFLRKIESLGPKFSTEVALTKNHHKALTAASSDSKKWEEEVKKEIVQAIKEIDEKISSYKYITSKVEVEDELHKVIGRCHDKFEDHKKKPDYTEEKTNEEDNTNQQESWVATALKDVDKKFVTNPDMRFNDLEPILQRCLLSLCVFPYKQVIKKRSIIYLWIGEGLVQPTSDRTAEKVGEGYFRMLLMSGLVLPIRKKHDKTARGCILRQNVWQMLKSRAEANGLFRYHSEEDLTNRSDNIERPLTCFRGTQCKEQQVVTCLEEKNKQVVTLFNSSAQYLGKFSRFKSIEVLQLGKWQSLAQYSIEMADDKFLDSMQVMRNLTYLGLEGISGITSLDLKHLSSLRILNLRACHHLEKLPSGITLLTKLTHLDVSECPLIDRMPKGLHKLSELQVLKGFIICGHQFTDSCRLQELVGLKKLRKLSINIARQVAANAHLEELNNFTSLRSLTITWGRGPEKPEQLLWYSNSIEKLDIRRIPHPYMLFDLNPRQFPNLKKLCISGGKLKILDLSSEEWKVETLRLKFLRELDLLEWSPWEKTSCLACIEVCECPILQDKFLHHLDED